MRGWTSSLGGRFGARTGDSELGQEIRSSDRRFGARTAQGCMCMHVHAELVWLRLTAEFSAAEWSAAERSSVAEWPPLFLTLSHEEEASRTAEGSSCFRRHRMSRAIKTIRAITATGR